MIFAQDVYDKLQIASYNPKLWQPPQNDQSLRDVYFLSTNVIRDSSLIYMGTVSAILPIIEKTRHSHLLLVEDVPMAPKVRSQLLQQGCSLLILPVDTDMFETFNLVKSLFSDQQWFFQQSYVLYNELLTCKDLSQVVALAENELSNPVILIDESFKVIQYSKIISITDEIWATNIKNGYCSYEFVTEVNKLNSVRQSPTTTDPFSVNCHANRITKWVCKLYFDNALIGYMVIPECHTHLKREQVKLLSVLSKIMVHHMGRTMQEYSSQWMHQEKLLVDLVENRIHSESELSTRLKLLGVSLTTAYRLVMIKADSLEATRRKSETLHDQLSKLYPEGLQVIYKDSLLLLLKQKEWSNNSKFKKESVAEILAKKNLRAIYSDPITDLLQLSSHYIHLANGFELAANLGKQEVLLPYNDLKFSQLLHDNIVHKDKLLQYCHPATLELLKYDKENNTSYYETLLAFLHNGQNTNETANELFIHRNTIKYRMKKINELIEIDLTKGETVFQLAYSLKILNYLRKGGVI
jgi:PucR family transcriptional regulator, proline-responsive transcriptional activator